MAETVDAIVLANAASIIDAAATADPTTQAALRRAWRELAAAEQADDTSPRVRRLERQAEEQRDLIRKATRKFALDEIDREAQELLRQEAHDELAAIEAELARLTGGSRPSPAPDLDAVLAELGAGSRRSPPRTCPNSAPSSMSSSIAWSRCGSRTAPTTRGSPGRELA